MTKAVLVVQSQASNPERDDEYHDWYANTHIKQLCDIPGINSARRFTLHSGGFGPADPSTPSSLAIYEIESDDIEGVMQEIMTRTGDGRIEMSDVIELDPAPKTFLYVERD